MKVINIEEQLEHRRNENWWKKVSNIIQVMRFFSEESQRIITMVEAHGDKDELVDGCVYPGIHEFFCEEPARIEADANNLKSSVEGIEPGRYVLILDVTEEPKEDGHFRYGQLTYMKKIAGEPL